MQPVSQLSMRLTSLWSAIIFDTILIFQNGSRSSFLFYISFIPNNWIITSVPRLTSLLSSVMLLVCTESITSSTSLVFSFNLTLSILLRFWGFGKLFFFISSTIFENMFCFSTVSLLQWLINSSAFSLPLPSSSSSCAICRSFTCCIGSVPTRFCSSCWASTLFSPLSKSLIFSDCSYDSQPFFWIIRTWSHNLCSPTWYNPFSFQKGCSLSIFSHSWLTVVVAFHCTNIILRWQLLLDSSLMKTGSTRPNHGTPSIYTPASFTPLLDTFVLDIPLIEVNEYWVALSSKFLSRRHL